jgi:hypothetical protein
MIPSSLQVEESTHFFPDVIARSEATRQSRRFCFLIHIKNKNKSLKPGLPRPQKKKRGLAMTSGKNVSIPQPRGGDPFYIKQNFRDVKNNS